MMDNRKLSGLLYMGAGILFVGSGFISGNIIYIPLAAVLILMGWQKLKVKEE